MPLFVWKNDYSVKVNAMDNQHKQLFAIMDKLHEYMKVGKGSEMLESILTELSTYTQRHFGDEEKLMAQHGYPGIEDQKRAHKQFIDKISEYRNDIKAKKLVSAVQTMDFLKKWLLNHIMVIDAKYADFFNQKGVN
ncbi:MAG: bacteriohemerythrin [Candidatus Muiribacteriota bacterium]|jgi:hemerythrin-like metal-binding protein